MKINLFILIICLCASSLFAQNNVLNSYIETALKSNLALQKKEYSYQKSLEALKEAKRMYFPELSLEASYSVTDKDKTITIPFGDVINPAYSNLNLINQNLDLTAPQYPQVDNQELSLTPSSEQHTKLVVSMPLFNSAIIQNNKIKRNLAEVEKINIDIYKRDLVKEVKEAYIKFLQTDQIIKLYNSTLNIVNQNLESRQSLYINNKITIDEVYAAKAQVKQVEKDLVDANKNKIMASTWFNFLLNRNLDTELKIDKITVPEILNYNLENLKKVSLFNRDEFDQLEKYIEIQEYSVDLEKGTFLPKISLGAQYGIQGEKYDFDEESRFASARINFSWSLFNSGQRKAKINQAQIDQKILDSSKQEVELQIQMGVTEAYYSLKTAQQGIDLAEKELQYFHKSYLLVEKKYQHGIVNYLEYSNSLNNKINSEYRLILAQYTYQLQQVKLEREVASYEF